MLINIYNILKNIYIFLFFGGGGATLTLESGTVAQISVQANNVNNPYPHKENKTLHMTKRPIYSENKAPLCIFFMGVDKRIFLPLPCGRPNTMRTTSTLLKNLNHHDENPAPPRPGD